MHWYTEQGAVWDSARDKWLKESLLAHMLFSPPAPMCARREKGAGRLVWETHWGSRRSLSLCLCQCSPLTSAPPANTYRTSLQGKSVRIVWKRNDLCGSGKERENDSPSGASKLEKSPKSVENPKKKKQRRSSVLRWGNFFLSLWHLIQNVFLR